MRPTTAAGASEVAAHGGPLAEQARRPNQAHVREVRARRVRGVVACIVFAGMLAIGWMIGAKPPAAPSVQEEIAPKPPVEQTAGWIVEELPDGENCNDTVFDNVTQQVGPLSTEACQPNPRRNGAGRGFSWPRK